MCTTRPKRREMTSRPRTAWWDDEYILPFCYAGDLRSHDRVFPAHMFPLSIVSCTPSPSFCKLHEQRQVEGSPVVSNFSNKRERVQGARRYPSITYLRRAHTVYLLPVPLCIISHIAMAILVLVVGIFFITHRVLAGADTFPRRPGIW